MPVQVRADVLRGVALPATHEGWRTILMSGDAGTMSGEARTGGEGACRQPLEMDVRRAIAVADEAGLRAYRIEISPDGTLAIVVSAPPEGAKP